MIEITIFILAIFQSIFGVGLLVLGTPILLLLDFEFFKILNILLPCSMAVSLMQIYKIKSYKKIETKIIFISLPFIILGLITLIFFQEHINFKLLIGFIILLSFVIKSYFRKKFEILILEKKNYVLPGAAFFHGLTNTGGTIISLIFQTLKKNKFEIQSNIAFTYFFFSLVQYSIINLYFNQILFNKTNIIYVLISIFAYFLGANLLYKIGNNKFIKILNMLIIFTSLYLIISGLSYL